MEAEDLVSILWKVYYDFGCPLVNVPGPSPQVSDKHTIPCTGLTLSGPGIQQERQIVVRISDLSYYLIYQELLHPCSVCTLVLLQYQPRLPDPLSVHPKTEKL